MSQIILYTTPLCAWCDKTRAFLKEKKYHFIEIDVLEDRQAYDHVVQNTHQLSVPVCQIGEQWIVGFNPEAITRLHEHDKANPSTSPISASSSPHQVSTPKKKAKKKTAKREPLTKPSNPNAFRRW